jgi:hypothetical protein
MLPGCIDCASQHGAQATEQGRYERLVFALPIGLPGLFFREPTVMPRG